MYSEIPGSWLRGFLRLDSLRYKSTLTLNPSPKGRGTLNLAPLSLRERQGWSVEERKQGVDIVGELVKRFGDGGIAIRPQQIDHHGA